MRDLHLLGGVRDRDLPRRATGVWERDLSLRLDLDLVPLTGVPDRSRRDVALADCFCPERETSGDELHFSLCVEAFSLSCLLGGSSREELREAGAGLLTGEGEEEEEQLPLSEGERERWGEEPSQEVFLNFVSIVLEAGEDEETVSCCRCSVDVLVFDDRVPLRSSDGSFRGGEARVGDLLSLEEECL